MKKCYYKIIRLILFFITIVSCYGKEVTLSDNEIEAKLMELKPLPKVHYFWPQPIELDGRKLYELARITHSLSIPGDWARQGHVEKCVYTCARVNKTNPKIKASLSVDFNPWHIKFDKKLPPTDRGPSYFAEILYFESRLRLIKQWLEQSNKKYSSEVKITAVILDSEVFAYKEGDKKWNEAMRQNLDTIHLIAKKIFPKARIEWFERGISQGASESGWRRSPYFTGKEIKASLSCSFYTVPEIERTRETFRRTAKLADELDIPDVTPWVALASGFRRHKDVFHKFSQDWDYDIIYSYLLGAELNNKWYGDRPKRFAPYNRAKVVIFYPPPFYKKVPHWSKHFIAYVRGATSNKELKDLGLDY